MNPVHALDDYIGRFELEEKLMTDELEDIDEDLQRARSRVAAAEAHLKHIEKRKAECLETWKDKKEQHATKMKEVSVMSQIGEPVRKKLTYADSQLSEAADPKKKKEMITRFEQSDKPLLTMDQIRTQMEALRFSARQIQVKKGLCGKKCRMLSKLEMGSDHTKTRMILSQLIHDAESESSRQLQPTIPTATPTDSDYDEKFSESDNDEEIVG